MFQLNSREDDYLLIENNPAMYKNITDKYTGIAFMLILFLSGGVMDEKIFVIQKHEAKNTHFDFRLEIDGFLKSWAIPKGPSMDPSLKRLAIETEDHPMSYADFEGTIPEGEYGAGTVTIWDSGTYENRSEAEGRYIEISEAYKKGMIKINLKGRRMRGFWALIKTKYMGKDNQWLLIKEKDNAS